MKIGLLNVKYAPNLGDGAIAECIESQLKHAIPDVNIVAVDIGGREGFGGDGSIMGAKIGLTSRLGFLPKKVQSFIKTYLMPPLVKSKYAQAWHEKLHDCDAIIIGGGHLFMDIDLYFPYRIMLAVQQTKKGTPIFVHGVGVSKIWTNRGISCFKKAFEHGSLISASVRDKQSLENWNQLFPENTARICRDPALLAPECYGEIKAEPGRKRKLIAIGVADHGSLRKHADKDMPVVFGKLEGYIDLISKLYASGYDVALFTNGDVDDHQYLRTLEQELLVNHPALAKNITIEPKPLRPSDIVNRIASADVVIAHRLHANILAYAYGVPSIGLAWDRKLTSFFQAISRTAYLIEAEPQGAEILTMVDTLVEAGRLKENILFDEAKDGSQHLVHSIKNKLSTQPN